jgi:hypothetical protein
MTTGAVGFSTSSPVAVQDQTALPIQTQKIPENQVCTSL